MFKNIENIHFVGIGGIGMSGIAEVLAGMGYKITGSDIKDSPIIQHLREKGIIVYIGHRWENVVNADVVVYSSAVKMDNIELVYALKEKIPVIQRAEMLAELMRMKFSIGVAGTHGKTTTTSLIASIFKKAKLDPTLIIGGQVKIFSDSNATLGKGDYLIAEADESDKSFLKLFPSIAVITNIDEDHLDNYQDLNEIKEHFVKFANSVPFYGCVVICLDDLNNNEIIPKIEKKILTYGFLRKADVKAINVNLGVVNSSYTLVFKNMPIGEILLNIPGKHNVLNSLAAVSVAIEMGIPYKTIFEGIKDFTGVKRRFEIIYKNEISDIYIIDDYAHHPNEIFTVIGSAKNMGDYKIVTIFQPHLFSRTIKLLNQFADILSKSDITVITDIYPARELPVKGVSGKNLYDEIKKIKNEDVYYVEDKKDLKDFLKRFIKKKSIFLFIGAGDINIYSKEFVEEIKNENI